MIIIHLLEGYFSQIGTNVLIISINIDASAVVKYNQLISFELFQNKPSKGHVKLILASSYDTKMFAINGFTVMEKTEKIVVKGQSGSFGSDFLYMYSLHSQELIPENEMFLVITNVG